MRILIIGDVHGQHDALAAHLREVQSRYGIDAAIQVGDFGFERKKIQNLRDGWFRFPVPVHAIDGNHEDHAWLRRATLTGAVRRWHQELNLVYQPRPSVATMGGSAIGFLGGALHVDRPQQDNMLSRFPNYILRSQREHAATLFNQHKPDLVVTHSCPAGIGIGLRGAPGLQHGVAEHIVKHGFDPGPADDCGEVELQRLWQSLTYRPRGWVFGHFHQPHEARIDGTRFLCVGDESAERGAVLVMWDTDEKKLLRVRY